KKSRDYFFRARADCPAVDDGALSGVPSYQRDVDARGGWRLCRRRRAKHLSVSRTGQGAWHEDAQWSGPDLQEFALSAPLRFSAKLSELRGSHDEKQFENIARRHRRGDCHDSLGKPLKLRTADAV